MKPNEVTFFAINDMIFCSLFFFSTTGTILFFCFKNFSSSKRSKTYYFMGFVHLWSFLFFYASGCEILLSPSVIVSVSVVLFLFCVAP